MVISQPLFFLEHFVFSTFDSLRKQNAFIFLIVAQGLRYSPFLIFCQQRQQGAIFNRHGKRRGHADIVRGNF